MALSQVTDTTLCRRGKLLGHGLTKEQVDSILGEPRQLVGLTPTHASPPDLNIDDSLSIAAK